jgi:hypothetical protein
VIPTLLAWLLASSAHADAGSKTCRIRGLLFDIQWTESGSVTVKENGDRIVGFEVGALKGTTTLQCDGDTLRFLTDTHRVRGRFTLEKVAVDLSDVLGSLSPERLARAQKAEPRTRTRRPAPKPPPAPKRYAGEAAAEACVNTKAWDGYGDGWRVRTVQARTVEGNDRATWTLTLLAGNTYRFFGCSEASVRQLDLVLYGGDFDARASDIGGDRQPTVDYTPDRTETVHVVLAAPEAPGGKAGVALGVVHRAGTE